MSRNAKRMEKALLNILNMVGDRPSLAEVRAEATSGLEIEPAPITLLRQIVREVRSAEAISVTNLRALVTRAITALEDYDRMQGLK